MNDFEEYLSKLGTAIKKQREFKRLTQEQLVNRVHSLPISQSSTRQLAQETLSRIENGHFNPSIKQIYSICTALNTTPADLLFLSQNMEV